MPEETLIGYGPKTETFPYIPDFLIIQDDGVRKLDKTGSVSNLTPKELDTLVANKQVTLFVSPKTYRPGHWCAVENTGIMWFLKTNTQKWAMQRATEILKNLGGDPTSMLQSVNTAARLCGIPLDGLVKLLESNRKSPQESLDKIFQRIKDKPIKLS